MNLQVPIKMLSDSRMAPRYAFPTDAGADLMSDANVEILRGAWAIIPTGIQIAIPEGYVGLVHPRSGLAAKFGVTVLNAPGTIDADYRGEVKVILVNHGPAPFRVNQGDRIAQLVFQKVEHANFFVVREDSDVAAQWDTARGVGGFGSTGVKSV